MSKEEKAMEFLEKKQLRLKNQLEGYVIPYSQLVSLLLEYTNQQEGVRDLLFDFAKWYDENLPEDDEIKKHVEHYLATK